MNGRSEKGNKNWCTSAFVWLRKHRLLQGTQNHLVPTLSLLGIRLNQPKQMYMGNVIAVHWPEIQEAGCFCPLLQQMTVSVGLLDFLSLFPHLKLTCWMSTTMFKRFCFFKQKSTVKISISHADLTLFFITFNAFAVFKFYSNPL